MFLLYSFGELNMRDLVRMALGKYCRKRLNTDLHQPDYSMFMSFFCLSDEERHILMVLEGEYLRRLG